MAVLITGGTKGIGLAIAKRFAKPGVDIFIAYINDESSAASASAEPMEEFVMNQEPVYRPHPEPVVLDTLEDTPFYARSVIAAGLAGQRVTAMHESLSMDRFSTAWVQAMLPFRMPRN